MSCRCFPRASLARIPVSFSDSLLDNLAGGPDTPLVQTVVESEEGAARIYCLMTDCDPKGVNIGMPVEFAFRRFREARGFYNYFWKCRPLTGQ